jgi:YD repeat-containing protein
MKIIYITLALILSALLLYAQENSHIPEIIPPSPSLQNLERYGDYPVELSTGLTNISIPLWNLKEGKLRLPISISNHSSGRKVNDTGGALGIGWSLQAGGFICRSINGIADEIVQEAPPYIDENGKDVDGNNSSYHNWDGPIYDWYKLFNKRADGGYDTYFNLKRGNPDVFSYSLPNGKSGKFIITHDASNDPVAFTIPYDPIKVVFPDAFCSYYYEMDELKIIDTDGTQYWFGKGINGEVAVDYKWTDPEDTDNEEAVEESYTGWYLCTIISATKNDTIHLNYIKNYDNQLVTTEMFNVYDVLYCSSSLKNYIMDQNSLYRDMPIWGGYDLDNRVFETKSRRYSNYVLDEIDCNSSYIDFNYGTLSSTRDKTCSSKYLQNITIYDANDDEMKSFIFNQTDEFASSTNVKTKLLNSLTIKDANSLSVQKYDFDYYKISTSMSRFSIKKDWWGYFNNYNNYCLIPGYSITYGTVRSEGLAGANATVGGEAQISRSSSLNAMKQGMLKSIKYPTGGKTIFDYEANTYYSNDNGTQTCGGLRIKKISNTDENENPLNVKEYSYGNGMLRKPLYPDIENLITETGAFAGFCGGERFPGNGVYYRTITFNSDFSPEYFEFKSNLVYYDEVTEYNGTTTQNTGSTTYFYEYPYHEDATCFFSYNASTSLEKEFYYYSRGYYSSKIAGGRKSYPQKYNNWEKAWKTPILIGKNITGDNYSEFYLYEYDTLSTKTVNFNRAFRFMNFQFFEYGAGSYDSDLNYWEEHTWHPDFPYLGGDEDIWGIGYLTVPSGKQVLVKETIQYNYPNTTVETTEKKYYDYGSEHLMIDFLAIVNSNGDSIYTEYSYPFSSSNSSAVYDTMVNRNIITPVITKRVNNEGWTETETVYNNFHTNVFKPKLIKTRSDLNTTGYTEVTFNDYDEHGNLLKYTAKDGTVVNIIWGYDNTYPVAKIVGGAPFSISSASRNYINSYPYSDNSTDDAISDIEDELSSYVNSDNYQVSIYTYKPLIGMTSETSPTGTTVYYEYDDFGRISTIKNDDEDKLKEYNYDYDNK